MYNPENHGLKSRKEIRAEQVRHKRRRNLLISLIILAVMLGIGLFAYSNLYSGLQNQVTKVQTDKYLSSEARPSKETNVPNPEDPFSGALNILLIGSDERDPDDNSTTTGMRSDTVMVAHVSADRKRVEVISIPRDSWVQVPSCGLPDGSETSPQLGKFNAAFSLGGQTGDTGAAVACTMQTVENLTGIYLDDYVVINFDGFKDMVDSLGGVEFNVEEDIIDPSFSDTVIKAGKQTFDGDTALRYARVRKAQGMDGSDISRIGRQQELLAAIIKKAKSQTSNPGAMYKFAGSSLKTVTTSDELGNLNNMAGLAWSLRGVNDKNVVFKTVPVVDRGDGSNVLWSTQAGELWNHIKQDEPIEGLTFKNEENETNKKLTKSKSDENGIPYISPKSSKRIPF